MNLHLAAGMLAIVVSSGQAATFTVINSADSGTGSLRDAVSLANASPPPNMITFDPAVTGTIPLTSGKIQISQGPLTIVGPGMDTLTIDGNANNWIFIISEPSPPAPTCPALTGPADYPVTISGLTLQNAKRLNDQAGGAIVSTKSLTLDSMRIQGNVARGGAGVFWLSQYPGQSLTVTNSQFLNNIAKPTIATPASSSHGGAISIVENCTVNPTSNVVVAISNSLFQGNSVQSTTFSGIGGAIFSDSMADITITDTRIVNNNVVTPNPPVANQVYRGGGYHGHAKSLTIVRSEISDNAADVGAGLSLFNNASNLQTAGTAMDVQIIDSTISGNVAGTVNGAAFVYANVAVKLYNSTVANNAAAPTRNGGIGFSTGATAPATGSNALPGTLTLASSIVAMAQGGASDIGINTTTIPTFTVDAAQSLVGIICGTCSITGAGNLTGVDPALEPLAFNGGPTQTHALLAGSPAINAGSNPLSLTTDQRGTGFPRVRGGTTDMGAFESTPVATSPVLQSRKSRKTHGGAGTFDLTLSP